MTDDTDANEEKELSALQATLAELKAQYEAKGKELAQIKAEVKVQEDAMLFAARYGKMYVSVLLGCLRQACEEASTDANSLIPKLPPFTADYLTPEGTARLFKKLTEILTHEELSVWVRAHQIMAESFWGSVKKRSSNA
jgi:hypothetical protein